MKKEEKIEKKEKNYIKKPFLLGFSASVSILIVFIVSLISFLLNFSIVFSILILLINILLIVVCSSFYYLGKKNNSKIIKNTSIILAISLILSYILIILFAINALEKISQDPDLLNLINEKTNNPQKEPTPEQSLKILSYFTPFFITIILSYLILSILQTILAIGILKLEKIKFGKIYSILTIIYSWLPITIIGILFMFPLYIAILIIQSLMFYELAKQNKEIKNE